MKRLLLVTFLVFKMMFASGQQRFVDFNSAIPSNWTASNISQISLSNAHLKGGASALKWTPQALSILTASSLNIPSAEVFNYLSSSAQFFIYSTSAGTDTLIFKFYDASNVLKREGRMLLNYQGWREYHRSYRYDYNNGNESPGFLLNKMEIVYKPSTATNNTIYFDEMTFVGNTDARNPGPHMALDIQHFSLTSEYTKSYFSSINQADIPLSTVTSAELNAIQSLKNTYKRNLATVSSTDLANAKNFVNNCAIIRNTDGSIKGRGIAAIYDVDTLVQLSNYCSALARAYGKNNDLDALNKLNLFVEYLLDQGLAEGARVSMPNNDYTSARTFPVGFLEALPYLNTTALKAAVLKMLRWSNEFNKIYEANPIPGLDTDFIHVKSNFLVELALLANTDDEIARDLKSFTRYLEKFTYISEGARDGIKIDGTAFHHNSQHISYLYAFGTWISRAFELKGTPFKISPLAYQNMSFAIKTLFLETSKGAIYPHSASGRGPFPASVPVTSTDFDKLIQVGGDMIGQNIEPELAKFYNYVFQTSRYAVASINLDSYYQLNYGQTGIMRKNNWVAVSRGFTDRMFGAEIYAGANRYGRYQSYGALEILYDGSLASIGYISGGVGWDWNMMPGTTSVNQSYTNLKPLISGTASEYQADAFAGALADGNTGVFGMDFVQNAGNKYATSNLKFRKSVFTFDSVMVCLGSTISSTNTADPVITTLFQAVNSNSNPSIYINSLTATSGAYNQSLSTTANGVWLLNAQTTGFYIPKGSGAINVFRGTQTTPLHSTDDVSTTATANVSKAWITHGANPVAAKYQFVVVPGLTPQKMNALSSKIDNQEIYQVLKQTDSVHAVKFIPQNVIAYSCFLPQANINTGFVKGISARALLTVREKGDTLIVKIANPDLNAVDNAESKWIASVSRVTVSLIGNWKVAENVFKAGITRQDNLLEADFSLKDGLAQTLVLVKDDLTVEEEKGTWNNQSQQWIYDLATGTGLNTYGNPATFQQGSATINGSYSHSMSTLGSPGFLPYPPSGTGRVHIVNSTGSSNGTMVLNPNHSLKMSASATSSVNKFSVYNIANATPVASMFFSIAFSNADNGSYVLAMGNRETVANLFTNASGVYRATTELFTALQWDFTTKGINFNFRESATTNGGVYQLISNTAFKKGEVYDVEIYANNSASLTESYTRNGETYILPAGKLNIWVRPKEKLVPASRLIYNQSEDITSSSELARSVNLNSYLFQGTSSTLPIANAAEITLSDMEVNYALAENLPLTITSFTAKNSNEFIDLKWQTKSELNTDYFKVYSSIDGVNFEEVAFLKASGVSSAALTYQVKDVDYPKGSSVLYYKLECTDLDGKISYSKIITVDIVFQNTATKLFPNPAKDKISLIYNSVKQQLVYLQLLDTNGKVVQVQSKFLQTGINQIDFDVSLIANGMYFIKWENNTEKFITLKN